MNRIILVLVFLAGLLPFTGNAQTHNYPEALQKSMFFYEAQRSGELPADNRVSWRGDATVNDGQDVGHDLSGGWFDAGDHVKFNFPMAFSATALAWGIMENRSAYQQYGQLEYALDNVRWATDYLLKCHTAPNELYGQVGDGNQDHSYWIPAEVVHIHMPNRPSFKIDANNPGTDLACETAAALASASIIFQDTDPSYSQELLQHAEQLYEFGDTYRGKYSDAIPNVSGFYNSWSGYQDELVWGAIWLYLATNDQAYLNKAIQEYDNVGNEQGTNFKPHSWTVAWDDKIYASYVLLAEITGDQQYHDDARRFLDQWFVNRPISGKGPGFTPAGFPILDQWGSFRYAANTAFLLFEYSDIVDEPLRSKYYDRAKWIMDYILGSNPQNRSYVVGFGVNPPQNPHHRTAHGSWARSESVPEETRHILYGALVGGHSTTSDTDYVDNRSDYVRNEVATDYNALFSGALARLAGDQGGSIAADFPIEETPHGEFLNEVRINSASSTFTEVAVWTNNRSAWPARTPRLSFRYFVDLSEGFDAGYSLDDYTVSLNFSNAGSSGLQPWDAANDIYFVQVTFNEDVLIFPGGQGEHREEVQIRIALPNTVPAAAWDPSNDWSFQGVTNTLQPVDNVPVYANGQLVAGNEPGGGDSPQAEISASVQSGEAPLTVSFDASGSFDPNGDPLTYFWDFGDGETATGETALHTFQAAGNYTVELIVEDNDGNTGSAEIGITVTGLNSPPEAAFSATPQTGQAPLNVSFNASGSSDPDNDPLDFSWNFGDGASATGQYVNHTYATPGTYIATLTATDGRGGSDEVSITITVSENNENAPVAAVAATPLSGTAPLTVNFDAGASTDPDGDPLSYAWSFGDGGSATGEATSHTYTSPGSYTAVVTVSDGTGLSDQVSVEITVTPGETGGCDFGTPLTSGLPTISKSHNYIHVIGTGGPDLSNVSNFTINWSIEHNGLWQFSMNTTNGQPDWYVDLRSVSTNTFNQAQPDIIFSGSGFPGLDGAYWAAVDGDAFVLVSKSGDFFIYFSGSPTPPSCENARLLFDEMADETMIYPNPSSGEFYLRTGNIEVLQLEIFDQRGRMVRRIDRLENSPDYRFGQTLKPGLYIVRMKGPREVRIMKIEKR